mgnify:CR=1 FL=1
MSDFCTSLTLAQPVGYGQTVAVSYSDPSGGNDLVAIQDKAGNDALGLSNQAVTNHTSNAPVFLGATVHGSTLVPYGDKVIDWKRPFRRLSMIDAIKQYTGVDVSEMEEDALRSTCRDLNVPVTPSMGKGKLIDALFGEYCEKHLVQPTFITDYPTATSPLTKRHREHPHLTERFELFVNGKELANAYSELNDPLDQLDRFKEQLRLKEKGDDEAMFIDMDFIRALEFGMPPASGMGIGIDRLCMLMTDAPSIQDVLFFPQMRPE